MLAFGIEPKARGRVRNDRSENVIWHRDTNSKTTDTSLLKRQ